MSNKWNSDLTPEQNYILKEEGTEPPGSSHLNQEKREGDYHCAGCGVKLFSSTMKYESGSGWPSFSLLYQMYLKLKQTPTLVMKEQNITVRNVEDITDTYSMMVQNPQEKDFVIMVFA